MLKINKIIENINSQLVGSKMFIGDLYPEIYNIINPSIYRIYTRTNANILENITLLQFEVIEIIEIDGTLNPLGFIDILIKQGDSNMYEILKINKLK